MRYLQLRHRTSLLALQLMPSGVWKSTFLAVQICTCAPQTARVYVCEMQLITFTFAEYPHAAASFTVSEVISVRKGCSMHPGNVVLRTLGKRLPFNFNECKTRGYGADCKGVERERDSLHLFLPSQG